VASAFTNTLVVESCSPELGANGWNWKYQGTLQKIMEKRANASTAETAPAHSGKNHEDHLSQWTKVFFWSTRIIPNRVKNGP